MDIIIEPNHFAIFISTCSDHIPDDSLIVAMKGTITVFKILRTL